MTSPDIPYKPGALKRIKLVNFMCHESFEQIFGPRVSFIIGPNGSGKSALLTALMVALGGRATITSRAKKTSDFVMYGKKFAKITVELQNYEKIMDKDLAFRPDEYGKVIIIEKEIYSDDKMKLVLRDHHNKKISERKAELDQMLEHFGILINNPICILNQEVSKTFLHSKKPEDQYDLFMKATTLEDIEIQYNKCKEYHGVWDETNKQGALGFKLLDQEYANCHNKTKSIVQRHKNEKLKQDLINEKFWALVKIDEQQRDDYENNILSNRNEIATSRADIVKCEKNLKQYEEDKQELVIKMDVSLEKVDITKKKVNDLNNKMMDARTNRITKQEALNRCQKQIHRLNSEKKTYEKSIAEMKQRLNEQNSLHQDEEKRTSDIQSLENTLRSLIARLSTLDNEIIQIRSSISEKMKEQFTHQGNVRDYETKINNANSRLKRLACGQQNSLLKYGEHCAKVIEAIDRHHEAHPKNSRDKDAFAFKPIGPVGFHIKLKNPEIANPLEIHLGRNAHAFVCDNTNDMRILNRIYDRVLTQPKAPRPPIIVRKFVKKHDVAKYRTTHQQFSTLLDFTEIEEPAIYNICLDRCQLENILYIPDYNVAQNLLMTKSMIPANLRAAYTSDCYIMYPVTSNGGYRAYHNDTSKLVLFSAADNQAIAQTEEHIKELVEKCRYSKEMYQKVMKETTSQRKTYEESLKERDRLERERREKGDELSNLKLVIPITKPTELEGLEQDYETCLGSIATQEIERLKMQQELDDADRVIADIKSELDECTNILNEREKSRESIAREIQQTNDHIDDANLVIVNKNNMIENREKELEELELKVKTAREKLEESYKSAVATRPQKLRSLEEIEDKRQQLEAIIKAYEDWQDPEEVLRNLRKRMVEIENMTDNKNNNMTNFKIMSDSIQDREIGFRNLKNQTISSVSTTFAKVMRSMNMGGELKIYMDPLMEHGNLLKKGKTLEINIETNYMPSSQRLNSTLAPDGDVMEPSHQSQPSKAKKARIESGKENAVPALKNMTNTRSLSGGERSFSTVALVLALWQHCASPFKLMDEIDVFMDMVTRRISYNALIRFAQLSDKPGQYIFFSPLELPKFDDPQSMVQVFVMPTIVRKDQSSLPYSN